MTHVVSDEHAVRMPIVRPDERREALLTRGVEELHGDGLSAQADVRCAQVDRERREGALGAKSSMHETLQQRRLANAGVTHNDQTQQGRTAR
jgi:hypothetical protein